MNDIGKNILVWILIIIALLAIFSNFAPNMGTRIEKMTYTNLIHNIKNNQIESVQINQNNILGTTKDGRYFNTYIPWKDPILLNMMINHNVEIVANPPSKRGFFLSILINWFPFILLIGVWIFIMRQMGSGKGGGAFSFGKNKAKLMNEEEIKTRLSDVEGIEEAKLEISEIIDFLKDPDRYRKLGGKTPHGILMIGSPGTGKTLLARAIAGESGVPFFSISGSDFVEMFVGVGASRVRDMFNQAKKKAPCIIFVDEIDAVGRHRGTGLGGGHDEREQTLNQMLVEMDGFTENEGIIVIAATNRPDVLDPALLRPGRFDRRVIIPLPDMKGREKIIRLHMKKLPLDQNVKPEFIARGTPGFSGAELANLVNEAALFSARLNKTTVSMNEFEKAKDKILMGTERHSLAMNEKEKYITAYHESGHTIVGLLVPDHDPVYKVSIIPRGQALGVTIYLPERDYMSFSKQKIESQLSSLYGGRIAEELIYGKQHITTGASNDIERATELARNMVKKWGFSDKVGPLKYSENNNQPFLGHTIGTSSVNDFSDKTAIEIDSEIRNIININYKRAKKILEDNIDILHAMANALIVHETLNAKQIDDIMNQKNKNNGK